jgi:twinkle protein
MEVGKDFEENEVSEEEKRKAFEKLFLDEKIKVLDHQGSVSDDTLMEKIETLCVMGCKYIILDHLTIAVSEAEGDQNSAVDKVMSDLLKMAKRHNVWIGLISHLRKTSTGGQAFEEGKMPSMDDIKGSGSVKQISFQIIAFARDMTATNELDRNRIKVRVLKNRFNGKTGDAGGAIYSPESMRLTYVDVDFTAEPKLGV